MGLSFLYMQNEGGAMGYWEPLEIDGYPAVAYDNAERTSKCSVAIGLDDTKYLSTTVTADAGTDICRTGKWVAAAVLSTVQAR